MPIPAKQYDAVYRGEGSVVSPHPELVKGHAYVVYAAEQRGHIVLTPVSRVDEEHDRTLIRRNLGIPPRRFVRAEDLAHDWELAEWPYNWLALQRGQLPA